MLFIDKYIISAKIQWSIFLANIKKRNGGTAMEAANVYERKALVWKIVNDAIYVDVEGGKLLLNETVKIIWELIDGIRALEDIVDELMKIYGKEMRKNEIEEIVSETMTLMIDNNLIQLKENDDFYGWIKYE